MKEAVDEGGGPAGVVDGLSLNVNKGLRASFPLVLSGVEGGLEEKSALNLFMINVARVWI